MYSTILVNVEDRVGTITINREEYLNALARETYGEIRNAVKELDDRKDVGAIVITGKGKHFSAGGDIKRFKTLIETKEYLSQDGIYYAGQMTKAMKQCGKPIVAMINGVATGAGFSIALGADYRIVTPSSKLIMGFIKIGLPGDTGSIYLLSKLIGIEKASYMMMTGEPVKGEDAVQMGLATRLVEDGKLEEETYAFAKMLANMPTKAIARQKALQYNYFYRDLDCFYYDEALQMAVSSREGDFENAVNAFIEKKMPEFNK